MALGRKSWLFAGSDRGGQRAAAMYSIIVTAKMNDVDPKTWQPLDLRLRAPKMKTFQKLSDEAFGDL